MILQALVAYYERLLALDEISAPGWGIAKISFALELDDAGAMIGLHSLQTEQVSGKKTFFPPQKMTVPMPEKRSSGIKANFLCDHSGYILGIDNKGNPQRSKECFEACKELHLSLLQDTNSPAAQAVKGFFSTYLPTDDSITPQLQDDWAELIRGGNLIFWHRGKSVCPDPI